MYDLLSEAQPAESERRLSPSSHAEFFKLSIKQVQIVSLLWRLQTGSKKEEGRREGGEEGGGRREDQASDKLICNVEAKSVVGKLSASSAATVNSFYILAKTEKAA